MQENTSLSVHPYRKLSLAILVAVVGLLAAIMVVSALMPSTDIGRSATPIPSIVDDPSANAGALGNLKAESGTTHTPGRGRLQVGPEGKVILEYLHSPERVARYEAMAPRAGMFLAKALNQGFFGEPTRIANPGFKPIDPTYKGWGYVAIEKEFLTEKNLVHTPWAWVHWDGNNTFTDERIIFFSIPNKNDSGASYVRMYGPGLDQQWRMEVQYMEYEGTTLAPIDYDFDMQGVWRSNLFLDNPPLTLDEFKQRDEETWAALEAATTSWFSESWQNK